MNRRLVLVLGALVLSVGSVCSADKVEWRTDYDAARKEAAEKNLPLFIEFTTDDCYHCRRLESGPFRDAGIMGLLTERFVPLKIDAKLAPKLTQALRIQAYPTMIVASADGKIIGFLEGFLDVKPLGENMAKCLAHTQPDPLTTRYQEASKAYTNGEVAKAIGLFKTVAEEGKDRPIYAKAKLALQEIDQQALLRLNRAKQMHANGQVAEATELLADLTKAFAGTASAEEGATLLATLQKPTNKDNTRTRRAADLLAHAKEAFKAEKYHEVLDLCELLDGNYKDLPEATHASTLAAEVRNSPEKMAQACEHLNDRMATMYANLAETWLKKGERELAALNYEKAVRAAPASVVARDAQAKLAALNVKLPALPVQYQKPEREKKE